MQKPVPLYEPSIDANDDTVMVHVPTSREAPKWGGPGRYIRELDYDRDVSTLQDRIEKLQRTLWFWLPINSVSNNPEIKERVLQDVLLLIGLEENQGEQTAEEKGWVKLQTQHENTERHGLDTIHHVSPARKSTV